MEWTCSTGSGRRLCRARTCAGVDSQSPTDVRETRPPFTARFAARLSAPSSSSSTPPAREERRRRSPESCSSSRWPSTTDSEPTTPTAKRNSPRRMTPPEAGTEVQAARYTPSGAPNRSACNVLRSASLESRPPEPATAVANSPASARTAKRVTNSEELGSSARPKVTRTFVGEDARTAPGPGSEPA
jgi:hypothetical protein